MSHQIGNVIFDFTIEAKGLTRPLIKQVHQSKIICVNRDNIASCYANPPEADGVTTSTPDLKLSVFTADCIPLLFFTEDDCGPIAALHCGWRGAQANIVPQLLSNWQGKLDKTHVIIGPSILSCCFEVKEDLIAAFSANGYVLNEYLSLRESRTYFSLTDFIIKQHLRVIPKANQHLEHLRCTHCSQPKLPSYRRDKITDPRIRSTIRRAL